MSLKLAIIALVLALSALGVSGFATVRTFNDGESVVLMPVTTQIWSEAECEAARAQLDPPAGLLGRACRMGQNCGPYVDMIQAIADNCP